VSTRNLVLALIALTWVPLAVLTVAAGTAIGAAVTVPLVLDYTANVRFLVALPVLIVAERIVWAEVVDLSQYLVRAELVAPAQEAALEQLVAQFDRIRRARLIAAAAAVAVIFGVIFFRTEFSQTSTWQFVPGDPRLARSPAGWWYLLISVPVFQFLIFSWACRYVLWCWFLYRLSRFDLVLVPSHPDRSAGLRPIGQIHQYWALIVFALSSLVSAQIGLELMHGRSLVEFRVELVAFFAVSVLVLFSPFLVFSRQLFEARMHGLLEYGVLAAQYTRTFHAKWIGGASRDDLLGTGDIQSLADLANSYAVVRSLRVVPFEPINVLVIALAVALPFTPLVFFIVSPTDIVKGLIQVFL
jgi:hypothetical protein